MSTTTSATVGGQQVSIPTTQDAPVTSVIPAQRSQMTTVLWAVGMLLDLNASGYNVPITANNVTKITDWIASESAGSSGGWLHDNNPLNTGTGTGGGAGTGGAPTIQAGIQDSADTLTDPANAGYGYPAILANLEQDGSEADFISAVSNSDWASGHYNSGAGPGSAFRRGGYFAWATSSGGNPTGTFGQDVTQPIEGAVSTVTSWTSGLGTVLGDLTNKEWWIRVGMGVGGIALFGVGLVIFLSQTKTGQKVQSEAGTAGKDAATAAVLA